METTSKFGNWSLMLIRRRSALPTFVFALCLTAIESSAQFNLHSFTGPDGAGPEGGLVLDGNTLYGTTCYGGASNMGAIFRINTDGSGFVTLKTFIGSDGRYPKGDLILSGATLYGTTSEGGLTNGVGDGYGTVFKIGTDGTGFTVLKYFTGSDGYSPSGGLVLMGSTLYGTTLAGGTYPFDRGTVFKVNTDGNSFVVVKYFAGSDGGTPIDGLVLSGTTLYGVTAWGGSWNGGTVFRINTDGSGFMVLKNFRSPDDGTYPRGPLVLSGNELYGATQYDGADGYGTLFKINADGSGFAVLKDFNYEDGAWPLAGLTLSGATLYGVTTYGFPSPRRGQDFPFPGCGAVFKINIDASDYCILSWFSNGSGTTPFGGLVASNGTLYGTTSHDGFTRDPVHSTAVPYGAGKVFSLAIPLPSVTTLPENQTVESGCVADFAVDVAGFPALTYQYYLNGTNLIGSSSDCWLEMTNCQSSQSGAYTAVFTNIFGAVTSAPAMLSVIPVVERRPVPGINLMGDVGAPLNVEYSDALGLWANWLPLDTVSLTNPPQFWFDLTKPLPPQRFYRVWQSGTPSVAPSLNLPGMVPAITLTGNIGNQLRLDCINQIGPTDAWVTLDTVALTNTSQLYFDTSAVGQPPRLYRIVPVP